MAKIREDLVGVVDAGNVEGDGRLSLKAGETVPDGVVVGDHVLAEEKPAEDEKPKRRTRKGDSEQEG
jgi:hypothetical protein